MKFLRTLALLAPIALALPFNAQAAMDKDTRSTFISECVAAAGQKIDVKSAQSHCECGARQVDKNFSDAQIAQLNQKGTVANPELTQKLRKVVEEGCTQSKK